MVGRRVVITGLGTVNPCGLDVPSTWESLCAGRSGVRTVTRFDASDLPIRIAAEVKDFDGAALLGRRTIRRWGLFTQYAVVAGDEAMAHAGFDRDAGVWPEAERFGVYVGSGIGGIPAIYEGSIVAHEQGPKRMSAYFIPRSLINLATGELAIRHNAKGPSVCVATACACGNHAIGLAAQAIAMGQADVIVAGGTEASMSPMAFGGFMVMKALSSRNDDPATASRPFDAHRDGFVMGEGAGVVVLEELEHARARGARILAEVTGFGMSTDAHHITAPAPGGAGAAQCMRAALSSAGIAPSDVDYINAHGTSTPMNDRTETAAIRAVFGKHADRMMVSSTKSMSGHLLGAAGGLETIATVMALFTGTVPPTANLTTPDPECDLDYVAEGARDARPRVAINNGFGFGGTNATLVLQHWEEG